MTSVNKKRRDQEVSLHTTERLKYRVFNGDEGSIPD